MSEEDIDIERCAEAASNLRKGMVNLGKAFTIITPIFEKLKEDSEKFDEEDML